MNPFYTHRPYLIEELEKLKDKPNVKIIEFGVGEGSSLIFNEYAKKYSNLQIEAYETDKEWMDSMEIKYKLENYNFHFINDWNSLLVPENFQDQYDLVFIDQAPWEARIASLNLIKEKSQVIILHDYDYYNHTITNHIYDVGENTFFEKYNDTFNLINHHQTLPPTLVFNKK